MKMAIITLKKENFEEEVMKSDIPVLIDFWASWCGPCKMLSPVVDQVAEELQGKVKVGKVNVYEEQDLAQSFGIMSIPTLVLIKNGKVEKSSVGVVSKSEIIEMVK